MKRLVLYLLMLLPTLAAAQVKVARLKTAEADFKQTRISEMLTKPQVLTGKFAYSAPSTISWQYAGGQDMQLPEAMLGFISKAVSGEFAEENDSFTAEWDGSNLLLTPKKKQIRRFFSSILLTFNQKGVAQRVVLTEPTGDRTEIEFNNMKYIER